MSHVWLPRQLWAIKKVDYTHVPLSLSPCRKYGAFYIQARSQPTLPGAHAFHGADQPTLFGIRVSCLPYLFLHSLPFLILPSPLAKSGRQVSLGGKEMCLVPTILVSFVRTKMSVWCFWAKMGASWGWWDLLMQWSRVYVWHRAGTRHEFCSTLSAGWNAT